MTHLRDRFIAVLVRNPPPARGYAVTVVLGLLAIIGLAYVIAGGAVTTQAFYLLPLVLAVSWLGLGWGVAVALLAALSRIAGDLTTTYLNPDYYFAAADLSRVVSNRISSLAVNLVVVVIIHELLLLSRQLEQRVQERTNDLRQALAGRERVQNALFAAEARERHSIGRDLHDGLGQHLTATAMAARILTRRLDARADTLISEASRLEALITDGIDQTRRLARGLLLKDIQPAELNGELRELLRPATDARGPDCHLTGRGDPARLSQTAASHLYYIAREACRNAQRHSAATRIDLDLTIEAHRAALTVVDNGTGFDTASANVPGMGISIMRSRAELIGARLHITPGPARGTLVSCELALDAGPLL